MGVRAMTIATLFLGVLLATSYQPVKGQTDDSPTWTANGDRTTKNGVAVSQDYIKSGLIKFGDVLYIEGVGYKVVNDVMNIRHKQRIDVLVFTKAEERKFGTRKLKVWLLRGPK